LLAFYDYNDGCISGAQVKILDNESPRSLTFIVEASDSSQPMGLDVIVTCNLFNT